MLDMCYVLYVFIYVYIRYNIRKPLSPFSWLVLKNQHIIIFSALAICALLPMTSHHPFVRTRRRISGKDEEW